MREADKQGKHYETSWFHNFKANQKTQQKSSKIGTTRKSPGQICVSPAEKTAKQHKKGWSHNQKHPHQKLQDLPGTRLRSSVSSCTRRQPLRVVSDLIFQKVDHLRELQKSTDKSQLCCQTHVVQRVACSSAMALRVQKSCGRAKPPAQTSDLSKV